LDCFTQNSCRRSACSPAGNGKKKYHLRSCGTKYAEHHVKTKSRVGDVRPDVSEQRRGRQEAALSEKKMQTWTFAFFSTFQPSATAGGCSSPFEPVNEWVCERSLTTKTAYQLFYYFKMLRFSGQAERVNPSYLAF
jgi:hypothetical protein